MMRITFTPVYQTADSTIILPLHDAAPRRAHDLASLVECDNAFDAAKRDAASIDPATVAPHFSDEHRPGNLAVVVHAYWHGSNRAPRGFKTRRWHAEVALTQAAQHNAA